MDFSKVKMVTHKNCQDGSMCAILFLAAGGKKENLIFTFPTHHEIEDVIAHELLKLTPLILADVSVPLYLAEEINDWHRNHVVLLDHHKSAFELKHFDWCEIDDSRCGSKIFYDFLKKNDHDLYWYDDVVKFVDDNDRWQHHYPESKQISALHHILGQEQFIERFLRNASPRLTHEEEYLISVDKVSTQNYVKEKKKEVFVIPKEIDGHRVNIGCVKANTHQSILGHSICEDPSLGVDIALMVSATSISMRSGANCPVDLSALARKNGGGGHRSAAGCSLSLILGTDLIDLVLSHMKF